MSYKRCKYCGGTGVRKNFREVIECTGCGAPSEEVGERPMDVSEAIRLANWSVKDYSGVVGTGYYIMDGEQLLPPSERIKDGNLTREGYRTGLFGNGERGPMA
jgi:hypothetical protein